MRYILFTLSLFLTSLTLQSQEIGFFGKKNNFEINIGAKPDLNKKFLFNNTDLTFSINYGFVLRRQIKSNKAIGISMSSTKLNVDASKTEMIVPSTSTSYYNNTIYVSGKLDAAMRISRYAMFMEFGKNSSTLPIGLSNELGFGVYTANVTTFSFKPKSGNYSDAPTKSEYVLTDQIEKDVKKLGVYFHWRLNLKIAISEKFLINISYLSNISFPMKDNYEKYSTGKAFFSNDKTLVNRAAYMDIGTFKIGGVFVF